jgi:hypothetical protein
MDVRSRLAVACPLAVATALVVGACVTDSELARRLIAPDFSRIDDTRLQDAMWRLGNSVQALSEATSATGVSEQERQQKVLGVLDVMADAAASVNKPGQKQGHKNLAMNIDTLIADIAAAKTAAQAGDLGPAQTLPMTCLACHQGEAGGAQK